MTMRIFYRIALRVITAFLTIYIAACQPPPTRVLPMPVESTQITTGSQPTAASVPLPTVEIKTPTPADSPTPQVTSGAARLLAPLSSLVAGRVVGLQPAEDGGVWLITEQEVARLYDGKAEVYLSEMIGKPTGIDGDGSIWIAAEDGTQISAWNGRGWSVFGSESGWTPLNEWSNGYVSMAQGTMHNGLWFGTPQDVRMFDGSRWTIFTPEQAGISPPVYDDLMRDFNVLTASDGSVWVFECDWGGPGPFGGGGVHWYSDNAWHGVDSPASSGCASALVEDIAGSIWVGVESSLWRYEPDSDLWTEFPAPEVPVPDMRFGYIESLSIAPDGDIWAVYALCGGASCFGLRVLFHLYDGQWIQVGDPAEYSNSTWGPLFAASGTGWLAWSGSVYQIRSNTLELAAALESTFGACDSSGRVWFVAAYEGADALWVIED